jgi:hypothetical protein
MPGNFKVAFELCLSGWNNRVTLIRLLHNRFDFKISYVIHSL